MDKQKLYTLKNDRAEALEAAAAALDAGKMEEHQAEMERVKGFNAQIEAVERLLSEQERFGQDPGQSQDPTLAKGGASEDGYTKAVKAFAQAAREGFRVTKAAGDQMQEAVDADGGYLVPQDIVTRILRLRDSKESLLTEVTHYPVRTASGRRTIKKRGQHKGFATVAEAAKFAKTDLPQFETLTYTIKKRGGVLPVTNELIADSDEQIAALAVEWLSDEARVTGNKEVLAVIAQKSSTDLKDLDGIISAWIKLGSTFRASSKLYTNDDGLAWLATLKDTTGRYLLSPNPADPKQLQLCAGPHILPVKTYDNDTMPNTGTKVPMILGDLKEGVAYWDRQQFSVKVSDTAVVGTLNAFEQDLTLWRGSLRDDCTKRDDSAFVNGYIDTAVAAAVMSAPAPKASAKAAPKATPEA